MSGSKVPTDFLQNWLYYGLVFASRFENMAVAILVDVGLLGAMAQLDKETVVGGNGIFEEFKGSLTEQCVCQQLVSDCGLTPYYWSAKNSSGEIDFLVQGSNSVYAIEVKAEENLRAKSLRAFKIAIRRSNPCASACRATASRTG